MATRVAQYKWRQKNRLVKSQLNVMVRRLVHRDLEELANAAALRGKGEAVSLASFLAKGLHHLVDRPHCSPTCRRVRQRA